jgi:DNA-binding transcriptional ArsR family regulator
MAVRAAVGNDTLERVGTALADRTRRHRRILMRLLDGPAYPAELADLLDASISSVSNHLACLRGCGLVRTTREGRQIRYEIADRRLRRALAALVSVQLSFEARHVGPGWAVMTTVSFGSGPAARRVALDWARWLNRFTIGWNVVEGLVALGAGAVAGSVGLAGFGLDSFVEVLAALILARRLHADRAGGFTQVADRRATRAIAVSFAVLAAYVTWDAMADLIGREEPRVSVAGIGIAVLSLVVMPVLAHAKGRLAPILGSQAQAAEASQTSLWAWLSLVLFTGLGLNALAGWWWADPVAGLAIAGVAGIEAIRCWRAEGLADTCCA